MPVLIAFIAVVLIWGTTPLAVRWSMGDVGFLFAVLMRMALGLVICLVAVGVARDRFPTHGRALLTYLAGGMGVFGAMGATYWGSQYIPSGWVSVLFGLSPILTGLLARVWLDERFGWERWAGTGFGIAGLAIIFVHGVADGSEETFSGVLAIVCAVFAFSGSSIAIKRLGGGVPAFATTTGTLAVAVPCFAVAWALVDGHWPSVLPIRTVGAIAYLGIVASVVGFVLFYFVLGRLEAGQAMLIPLLAPVIAVSLGVALNGETLDGRFLAGSGMILAGLAVYQWGRRAFGGRTGRLGG